MPSIPLPGLDACANYARRVLDAEWWRSRFPDHDAARMPRFRPGHGARQAFYREDPDGPTITLPRRYRTKAVVLHELTHWTMRQDHDLPSHGRTFARIMLDATFEFLGSERGEALAQSYAEQKVRLARPARLGPDRRWRYGWDERLRLGKQRTFSFYISEGSARDPHESIRIVRGEFCGYERGASTLRVATLEETTLVAVSSLWDVRPIEDPAKPLRAAGRLGPQSSRRNNSR